MAPDILPCSCESFGVALAAYLNYRLPPLLELSTAFWSSWLQSLFHSIFSLHHQPWLPLWPLDSHYLHPKVTAASTEKDGMTLLMANLVDTWQPQGLLTYLHKQCDIPRQKQYLLTYLHTDEVFAYSQTLLMK